MAQFLFVSPLTLESFNITLVPEYISLLSCKLLFPKSIHAGWPTTFPNLKLFIFIVSGVVLLDSTVIIPYAVPNAPEYTILATVSVLGIITLLNPELRL